MEENKEKQIEEMSKIIENAFKVYFGANDLVEPEDFPYQAKDLAKELLEHYQPKIPKDSVVNTPTIQCEAYSQNDLVVLSREEFDRLKRVETEKDRLYEIKLDLENQLIEKGWTEYEGADEIEKRVSKETAEKYKVAMMLHIQEMQKYLELNEEQAKILYHHNSEIAKQFGDTIKE